LAVVVTLVVAAVLVFVYLIEGPAPSKLVLPVVTTTTSGASGSAATGTATSGVAGTYHVGAGSEAGYRVTEVLVGLHTTAVGRTTKIWGSLTVSGTTVTAGTFSVNMASVKSDQSGRNAQFDGRIMDVARYPTATLTLTRPIALGSVPAVGARATYTATGNLDLHGVTRQVTFTLSAERTAGGIYVLADVPVTFAEWDITNPSVGGLVTTASSGTLEVLVDLTKGQGNAAASGSGSSVTPGGSPPTQVTVPSTTVPQLTIPTR